MKSNMQIIEDFIDDINEITKGYSLTQLNGEKLFSYGTCIAQRVKGGYLCNKTKYSVTTSKWQNKVFAGINADKSIYLENIPIGTTDLRLFVIMSH